MQEARKIPQVVRLNTPFVDPQGDEKRWALPALRRRHLRTGRSFYHEFMQLLGALLQVVAHRDSPARPAFHNALDTKNGIDGAESPVVIFSVDRKERDKLATQVEELERQQQELHDLVGAKDHRINELIGLVQRLTRQPDTAVARLCQVPPKPVG